MKKREQCKNDVILSMDYSETELETVEQELFAQAQDGWNCNILRIEPPDVLHFCRASGGYLI